MKKYYCDVCSDEFTRRWNLGRHRQTTHGSKPTAGQSSQLGNLSTNDLGTNHFDKTSKVPGSTLDKLYDDFIRRWNFGRHRQTTHGSNPISTQSSQLGNLSTDALGASYFSKTSNVPEVFDVFWKMNTLEELGEINANLSTIVSILKDMQSAKK
jgi:hypothetical protein